MEQEGTTPLGEPVPVKEDMPVRPWVRYWARSIDYGIAGFSFGLLLGIFFPGFFKIKNVFIPIATNMAVVFLWAFVEAFLISTWGTTPGKSLLRTFVRDPQGGRLRYSPALKRSLAVWVQGMAAGLPVVTLITNLAGYYQLTRKKVTVWDKGGSWMVVHKKIGTPRVVITVLLILGFLLIFAIENAAKKPGIPY